VRPDALACIDGPVGSEDIVHVPGTSWLIASGLNLGTPAQLSLIDTRTKSATALSVSYQPGTEGDRGAAPPEIFAIDSALARPALRWVGCVLLPANALPNAVRPLADGSLLVICPYDPTVPDFWSRMARAQNTGRILKWRADQGIEEWPHSAMSGGNGLEVSADGKLVYASAWSARQLVVFSLPEGTRRAIALDFMPDNIHALADGTLLVAGQRTTVEAICGCADASCPQPWVIARIDVDSAEVRELLAGQGTEKVNYACGALVAGDSMYVTVRGDRCIVYKALSELPSMG
jgi:hypothetical protein